MKRARLQYAKLAPQFVQAIGLFRSIRPGAREQRLDVKYDAGDLQFHFQGPDLLGCDDMRVHQAIVAIACAQHPRFTVNYADAGDDKLKKIKALLEHKLDVRTTYDELAREIGYNAGGSSADMTIRNALERLFTVSVFIQPADRSNARTFEAGHIFERLSNTEDSQLVALRLCPVLSFAVLGGPGTYMRANLVEARKLKTDIARLIHLHLAWLAPVDQKNVGLDTLVSYVYGNDPASSATQRQRRRRVKVAIVELKDELNWTFQLNRSSYRVSRPSSKMTARRAVAVTVDGP